MVNKIYYRIECEWVSVRKEREREKKYHFSKCLWKLLTDERNRRGWRTEVMFRVKRSFHYPFIDFLLDQRFLSFNVGHTEKIPFCIRFLLLFFLLSEIPEIFQHSNDEVKCDKCNKCESSRNSLCVSFPSWVFFSFLYRKTLNPISSVRSVHVFSSQRNSIEKEREKNATLKWNNIFGIFWMCQKSFPHFFKRR